MRMWMIHKHRCDLSKYSDFVKQAKVNQAVSYIDLVKRCSDCKQRIYEYFRRSK